MTELSWAMGIGTAAVLILGLFVFRYIWQIKGSGKHIIYLAVSIMWLAWGSYVAVIFMLIERNNPAEKTTIEVHEVTVATVQAWDTLPMTAGIFGLGKRKYNKKKIQRQNSPKRKNRRAKRLQRRYGIAWVELTGKEVQDV